MASVKIEAKADRRFPFKFLEASRVAVGEVYEVAGGLRVQYTGGGIERKQWPPEATEYVLTLLDWTGRGLVAEEVARRLWLKLRGVRARLNGRTVESEEEVLEVLRRATGTGEDGAG